MSNGVERVAASERLRLAVLGDFDGVHTRSWIRWFIERGHDVHCISYYAPRESIAGATLHVLRGGAPRGAANSKQQRAKSEPQTAKSRWSDGRAIGRGRGLIRLANALRY